FPVKNISIPALNGKHGPENGFIPFTPGNPLSEYVFPDHHSTTVHPGLLQFCSAIPVPPCNDVLDMSPFIPFIPDNTRHIFIAKPLRPRLVMSRQYFQLCRQFPL